MLDLFVGRWGWSRGFLRRNWDCTGVDLVRHARTPKGCTFLCRNVLSLDADFVRQFDFVCASSPCEQFSLFGLPHFFPNPPYPELGIRLFNHAREICESAGVPYVMENVRSAAASLLGVAA